MPSLSMAGECSLKVLTKKAAAAGLAKQNGWQCARSRIHYYHCTGHRGPCGNTYVKPFDVFAKGSETGDWLVALDDFRNWLIRAERV